MLRYGILGNFVENLKILLPTKRLLRSLEGGSLPFANSPRLSMFPRRRRRLKNTSFAATTADLLQLLSSLLSKFSVLCNKEVAKHPEVTKYKNEIFKGFDIKEREVLMITSGNNVSDKE